MASTNRIWFSLYLGLGVLAACAEQAEINEDPAYAPSEPAAPAAVTSPSPAADTISVEEEEAVTTVTASVPENTTPVPDDSEDVPEAVAGAETTSEQEPVNSLASRVDVDEIQTAPEEVLEEAKKHSTGLDVTPIEPIAQAAKEAETAARELVETAETEVKAAPIPDPAEALTVEEVTSAAEAAEAAVADSAPEPAPVPAPEPTAEPVAEAVPAPAPSPAPLPDGVLASGEWVRKTRRTQGTWSIVRESGDVFIRLDEDFSTRNAPDLKIFLSPISAADVGNANAINGARLISLLSSNKGAQSYAVPEDVNLDDYASILIHCEAFTKLWSAADLR